MLYSFVHGRKVWWRVKRVFDTHVCCIASKLLDLTLLHQ